MQETIIDATNKTLGRLASAVAHVLRGKDRPDFDPSKIPAVRVTVEHAGQVRVTGNKLRSRYYYRFSGYPGGLKKTLLRDMMAKSPTTVVRRAVARMLPNNKLRARLLARLIVKP